MFIYVHSRSFTLTHVHPRSFTFIHIHSHSFTFIHIHSRSFTFIHVHSRSFTFIHVHSRSFTFIHINSRSFTFIHRPTHTVRCAAPACLMFVRVRRCHVFVSVAAPNLKGRPRKRKLLFKKEGDNESDSNYSDESSGLERSSECKQARIHAATESTSDMMAHLKVRGPLTLELGETVSMVKYRGTTLSQYQTFKVSKYRLTTGWFIFNVVPEC